jgi:hypothetical protein
VGAISRRELLTGLSGRSSPNQPANNEVAKDDTWTRYLSWCGATIDYPASWAIDSESGVNLLYPHHCFALRNAPGPPRSAGDLPHLASYSPRGIYLWLLHYDERLAEEECPPYQSISSCSELEERNSEFSRFRRYAASFSGSRRSYVLRLWVGASASSQTRSVLDTALASMLVP